ncbi:hypothetical protein CC2G_004349 [Coprinopsis cinerea AmutBmut pab1-1]|nr:hypothetical protein CC2G_004349 [Coprinopsis cinerea AmutBmut pab1-1]
MAVFSCLICLENFDIDTVAPVILACHHIFCFNCVRNLIQRDMACPFRCPGGPVTPPDVTPTNFSIISTSSADNKQVVSDAVDNAVRHRRHWEGTLSSLTAETRRLTGLLCNQRTTLERFSQSITTLIRYRDSALASLDRTRNRLISALDEEHVVDKNLISIRVKLLSLQLQASRPGLSSDTSPTAASTMALVLSDSRPSTPSNPTAALEDNTGVDVDRDASCQPDVPRGETRPSIPELAELSDSSLSSISSMSSLSSPTEDPAPLTFVFPSAPIFAPVLSGNLPSYHHAALPSDLSSLTEVSTSSASSASGSSYHTCIDSTSPLSTAIKRGREGPDSESSIDSSPSKKSWA